MSAGTDRRDDGGRGLRTPLVLLVVLALAAVVPAPPARAHDVWIEPSTFSPEPGAAVALHLRVGHGGHGAETLAAEPEWLERIVVAGPGATSEAHAAPGGGDPAAYVRPAGAGVHVVGLRSGSFRSELSAERFESYLAEEGLEQVRAARRERGESTEPGREEFSRSLKCLLTTPGVPAADRRGYDRRLGFELELVPETNPFLAADEGLVVRVLRAAGPVAEVLIEARPLRGEGTPVSARTGSDGRATLPLEGPPESSTVWLLTAVTMTEAPGPDEADWRSVWAALTFERRAR